MDIATLRLALEGAFAPLTQYKQFMLWRLTGVTKKPINPYTLIPSDPTDPINYVTADEACRLAELHTDVGVAFCFTALDPFVFIDVDKCWDGSAWSPMAMEICAAFPNAACEVSQSGVGLHLFMTGAVPEGMGHKRNGLECYVKDRFVALTGSGARGNPLSDGGQALIDIITKYLPAVSTIDGGAVEWREGPIPEWSGPVDDDELIALFLAEPSGRRDAAVVFGGETAASNADVWHGRGEVLARSFAPDKPGEVFDRSRADMSLAMRLARWTGKDCPRIERLMRRSELLRTRWDERWNASYTRVQHDIVEACAKVVKVVNIVPRGEVVAPAAMSGVVGFEELLARVSDAGSEMELKSIAEDISRAVDIDRTFRISLAGHVHNRSKVLLSNNTGWGLPHCKALCALRRTEAVADRRAMQRELNKRLNLPDNADITAPVLSVKELVDEFVYISRGKMVASLFDRNCLYKLDEFREYLAGSVTAASDGSGRTANNVDLWMRTEVRMTVSTRTFHPGTGLLTYDPDGVPALNTWRAIERGPYITVDVTPFIDQIRYLFGADSERFIDWLAHIEQHPGDLPHHGWLHIAREHGCGRGWVSSVLSRLWRGYVAPSLDLNKLIAGDYNGDIAGRLIAIIDEIREGAREDAYMMEGKIREIMTVERRMINPKYGSQYSEHNACRWLVFSNHKSAMPLDAKDRRWNVCEFEGVPRDEHVYQHLYRLLADPAFIDSIGVFLRTRDIAHFNPGSRALMSDAKLEVIASTRSEYRQFAEEISKHWPADVITWSAILNIMSEGVMGAKINHNAVRHALEDVGMSKYDRPIWVDGAKTNRIRVWIVRDRARWSRGESDDMLRAEMDKVGLDGINTAHKFLINAIS